MFTRFDFVLKIFCSQGLTLFLRYFVHKVGSQDILFTRLVLRIFYSEGWFSRHFVHKVCSQDSLFTMLVIEILKRFDFALETYSSQCWFMI